VALMRKAELRPIVSIWGHRAGNPAQNPEATKFIGDVVRELIAHWRLLPPRSFRRLLTPDLRLIVFSDRGLLQGVEAQRSPG
jgi:hypothetical protein